MLSITTSSAESLPGPTCSIHSAALQRSSCSECNASYMSCYQRRQRRAQPEKEIFRRARERAKKTGVAFDLTSPLAIPSHCPALGIPLKAGGTRSANSPSLDRIDPLKGYVRGNVRIICDRANRLKGNRTLAECISLATTGALNNRDDFKRIAAYLAKEEVLAEVRVKADSGGRQAAEWRKIETFLDARFACGAQPASTHKPHHLQ